MLPIAALAVATHFIARVGPISTGQTLANVQHLLGSGTKVPGCSGGSLRDPDCPVDLKYTDGKSVLTVGFDLGLHVFSIEVQFASPSGSLARVARSAGAIASWSWRGGRIDRLPVRNVDGWRTESFSPGSNCRAVYRPLSEPSLSATIDCRVPAAVGLFEITYDP